jgi:hypothetical protein
MLLMMNSAASSHFPSFQQRNGRNWCKHGENCARNCAWLSVKLFISEMQKTQKLSYLSSFPAIISVEKKLDRFELSYRDN